MKIISWIRHLPKLFPKSPRHTKEAEKAIEREVVSIYGKGNTSLQLGLYITEEEVEQQKADLITYHF